MLSSTVRQCKLHAMHGFAMHAAPTSASTNAAGDSVLMVKLLLCCILARLTWYMVLGAAGQRTIAAHLKGRRSR